MLVMSHDCDLGHGDIDAEPHVEVIRGRWDPTPEEFGSANLGKHPRRYALRVLTTASSRLVLLEIAQLRLLDRSILRDQAPHRVHVLSLDERRRIAQWRAIRYTRRAMADAFDRRVTSKARSAMRRAVERSGADLSRFLIAATREELLDEHEYEIELVGVVPVEAHEDPSRRASAQQALDRIEAELNGCTGIDCEATLKSEDEVTLDDVRHYQHWNLFDVASAKDASHARDPLEGPCDEVDPGVSG